MDFVIRRKTTDWPIFEQVFLQEDYRLTDLRRASDILQSYRRILDSGHTPLIIDCGANNGLSTAWFARTYPQSFVVGIEPESENYAVALRNTERLSNVKLLHAAIAANDGQLSILDPGHGTSGYMTTRTEEDMSDKTIPAYSVASILKIASEKHPGAHLSPFIANIDIEGFESDLFSDNLAWIDSFRLIFVELHDWLLPGKSTATNFLKAVASRRRDFVMRGENVISIAHDEA